MDALATRTEPEATVGRRIAMLGTSGTTRHLAPFDQPDWEIWGHANLWQDLKRIDRWFELAKIESLRAEFPEYLAFLRNLGKPVFTRRAWPDIPTSEALEFDRIKALVGQEFLQGTVTWMIGQALLEHMDGQPISDIGVWGYDLSMMSEHAFQRPAFRHLMWICQHYLPALGSLPIRVLIPLGSELGVQAIPYPFAGDDPLVARLRARTDVLKRKVDRATEEQRQAESATLKAKVKLATLQGCLLEAEQMEQLVAGVMQRSA